MPAARRTALAAGRVAGGMGRDGAGPEAIPNGLPARTGCQTGRVIVDM